MTIVVMVQIFMYGIIVYLLDQMTMYMGVCVILNKWI